MAALEPGEAASRAEGPPELSEGTKVPASGSPRPLAKSGLDLAVEVQGPGLATAGRTPAVVGCILSRSWSPAFHEVEPRAVHRS